MWDREGATRNGQLLSKVFRTKSESRLKSRTNAQVINTVLCILQYLSNFSLCGIFVLMILQLLCKHCEYTMMFHFSLIIVFLILFSERQIASGLWFAWRNYIISQKQYKCRTAQGDAGASPNGIYQHFTLHYQIAPNTSPCRKGMSSLLKSDCLLVLLFKRAVRDTFLRDEY